MICLQSGPSTPRLGDLTRGDRSKYRLIALVVIVLGVLPSFVAGADDAWETFLSNNNAYDHLLVRFQSFRAAMSNAEALATLSTEVRAETPARFLPLIEGGLWGKMLVGEAEMPEAIVETLSETGVFPDDEAAKTAYEGMRACSMAGILLRHLIVGVADDAMQPREIEGRMVVDGTVADRAFALQFARCQLLGSHAWVAPPIGYHSLACQPRRETCPDLVDR